MILGKIVGKTTTSNFKFIISNKAKRFEFIQVNHSDYGYVLCQIVELERDSEKTIAKCSVIGYKEGGIIKRPRIPFEPEMEVLKAEDSFISDIIQLNDSKDGAYIGLLDGKHIKVNIDLKKLLTKHIAILAKTGAGKSYAAGVLLEEIIEKKVPLLIIDPHGEYSKLKYKNDEDGNLMKKFGVIPRQYSNIREYGDSNINSDMRPLRLNASLSHQELTHLLPKMSGTQTGLLYNALKDSNEVRFNELLLNLEAEENNAKYNIMNHIDYLSNLNLFSNSFTSYNELIQSGRCSIINLKGINPDVQEIIVYKLIKDMFEARKLEKVPPFFLIIEEAHNYCPERSFGETRCSKIIRTIASEGRKFGLGLCVISQRPARIDKSVLSQCTTQMILKVTNPNDLKAVYNSVEGLTFEAQDEIKNLPIGTALVTGVVDMPLFVEIRPRKTRHGGHAVDILPSSTDGDFFEKIDKFEEKGLLPLIKPKTSLNDLQLMSKQKIKSADILLIPGYLFICKDKNKEFSLLLESVNGNVILDLENMKTASLPHLEKLSPEELKTLQSAFSFKKFRLEEFISKTGFGIGVKAPLQTLVKLGYLHYNNDLFILSEKYVLSNLSRNACYEKINFTKTNYSKKLNPRISLDKLKLHLSKFTNVVDQRECFITNYKLNYE